MSDVAPVRFINKEVDIHRLTDPVHVEYDANAFGVHEVFSLWRLDLQEVQTCCALVTTNNVLLFLGGCIPWSKSYLSLHVKRHLSHDSTCVCLIMFSKTYAQPFVHYRLLYRTYRLCLSSRDSCRMSIIQLLITITCIWRIAIIE